MTNWGKYATVNAADLNKEIEELKDGDFPEIPLGKYEVSIDKMELKPTKKDGAPMLAVQFTILEGQYKKSKIFMNSVVIKGDKNDKYRVHTANTFLRSLGSGIKVSFEGVAEYEALIDEIFNDIDGLEYLLDYDENKSGYKTFKILEIFDKE